MQSIRQQAEKASIRSTRTEEMTIAPVGGDLHLMVLSPDGVKTPVSFNKTPIIVGRAKDADLPLDQKSISRKHLRIESEQNTIYVTDLGSSNGTYLDSYKLKAGERTAWDASKRLLVEGFVLQMAQPSAAVAAAPPLPVSIRTTEVKELLDHLQEQRKAPHVAVSASPKVVYVEMGKPQTIWVTVRPEDAPSAVYEVRVAPGPGIDTRWYTVSAPKMIASGQTEIFEIVIAAPSIDVVGGLKYEMIIEVAADNPQIPSAAQVVKLSVVPFMRFNIALTPNEVSHARRRKAGIIITNSGNYVEAFTIQVQSPDRLKVQPKVKQLELQAGQFKTVPLRFKPTRDASKDDRLLFSVMVSSKSGMTERAHGSYLMPLRKRIPRWIALPIGIVIGILINWFIFNTPPEAQLQILITNLNNIVQWVIGLAQGLRT
jgi:hypothetical protein